MKMMIFNEKCYFFDRYVNFQNPNDYYLRRKKTNNEIFLSDINENIVLLYLYRTNISRL